MKKLLSLVLVLSLVLGSFGMAFAAPNAGFADVDNSNVAEAVNRLKAFGIVDGYEDGTFRPDNAISREEFSKLLVEALGLGLAAEAAMGSTQFTDVPANWWSAGYINVAAGQDVVKGDPAGTFRPQAQVTYAEALTMIVRALGYRDEWLAGSWPGNFVSKAAELNLTQGVSITTNGLANRGAVAVMLNNALDTRVVTQSSFGSNAEFTVSSRTLMEDKLNVEKLENVVVTSIPRVNRGLNEDEIQLDGDDYEVVGNFDFNYLYGLTVDAYVNDDDEVFFYEVKNREFRVYYDVISDVDTDDDGNIEIINLDDDFDFVANPTIVVNNQTGRDVSDLAEGMIVKVVLNRNNRITFVDAFTANSILGGVVTGVDVRNEVVEYFDASGNENEVSLTDQADSYHIFDGQWAQMNIEDIKVDDVIYMTDDFENRSTGDDEVYVFVARNKVEGEVNRYVFGGDVDDYVRVSGKNYDLAAYATISLNEDDDIEVVSEPALEDITGEDVVVLLGLDGKVRHIRTDVEASASEEYGIIVRVDSGITDRVRIYTANGSLVTYEVDDSEYDILSDGIGTDSLYDIVRTGNRVLAQYEVNSDGEIEDITIIAVLDDNATATVIDSISVADGFVTGSHEAGRYRLGNRQVDSDSVPVFNLSDYRGTTSPAWDTSDIEVMTYKELYDMDADAFDYIAFAPDSAIEVVFAISELATEAEDVYAGYSLAAFRKSGDDYADINVQGLGIGEYELDTAIVRRGIVLFKMQTEGEAESVVQYVYTANTNYTRYYDVEVETGDSDFEGYEVYLNVVVDRRSGSNLTFVSNTEGASGINETYRVASDAVIYEKGDSRALFNISAGDVIDLVVNRKDGQILVIKKH